MGDNKTLCPWLENPKVGQRHSLSPQMEMGAKSKTEGADDCGQLKTYLELVIPPESSTLSGGWGDDKCSRLLPLPFDGVCPLEHSCPRVSAQLGHTILVGVFESS